VPRLSFAASRFAVATFLQDRIAELDDWSKIRLLTAATDAAFLEKTGAGKGYASEGAISHL